MTKKWSFKSKVKFFLPKPLWNNIIKKAIAKSTTFVVLSRQNKKSKNGNNKSSFNDNNNINFNDLLEETQIISCIDETSSNCLLENEQTLKVGSIILHKPVIKYQVNEVEIKKIYYFVNFLPIYQFKKNNNEKNLSLLPDIFDDTITLKIEKNISENLLDYVNELQKHIGSGMLFNNDTLLLVSLSSIDDIYLEYSIKHNKYIKQISTQNESNENLLSSKYLLEQLSQFNVNYLDIAKCDNNFSGITKIESESSNDILIAPFIDSIECIPYGISNTDLCLFQNEHVAHSTVNNCKMYDNKSENKVESLSYEDVKIEENEYIFNNLMHTFLNESIIKFDTNKENVPKLLSKTSVLENVFKYMHGISSSPTKEKNIKLGISKELSLIDTISLNENYSNQIITNKSSTENSTNQVEYVSSIYAPFSVDTTTSCPSFYIKENDIYHLDLTRIKSSLLEVKEQIQKLLLLEKRLSSYYEFLLDQQSSA